MWFFCASSSCAAKNKAVESALVFTDIGEKSKFIIYNRPFSIRSLTCGSQEGETTSRDFLCEVSDACFVFWGFLRRPLGILGGVNGLHYCPLVKTLHLHSFQKSRQLEPFHHHCHPYHQSNTTTQEEGMLHTKENNDYLAKFLELLDRG